MERHQNIHTVFPEPTNSSSTQHRVEEIKCLQVLKKMIPRPFNRQPARITSTQVKGLNLWNVHNIQTKKEPKTILHK
jgi:hypothetical protein